MSVRCYKCSTELKLAPSERLAFFAHCAKCNEDLHICLNCQFHDPSAYNECREPSADRVSDRERANRCEYFKAKGDGNLNAQKQDLKAMAEALFKKKGT